MTFCRIEVIQVWKKSLVWTAENYIGSIFTNLQEHCPKFNRLAKRKLYLIITLTIFVSKL